MTTLDGSTTQTSAVYNNTINGVGIANNIFQGMNFLSQQTGMFNAVRAGNN